MSNETKSLDFAIAASQNIKEKDYWLKQLSGDLVRCCFPYDPGKAITGKKAEDSDGKDTVEFTFTPEIASRLIRMSNQSDVRLFMILTAALVVLVNKYTGHNDIIVGTSINRQEQDLELLNTILALRNRLNHHMTFKELLLQVRKTYTDAMENQDYPFDTLLYQLGLSTSEANFSLFDIVILLENIHDKRYIRVTQPGVMFSCRTRGETIEGVVEYKPFLYDKNQIQGIIRHYQDILKQVLFNTDIKIPDIDMLSEVERQQLLMDFNDTTTAYPDDKTLHLLFAEQAGRTPDLTALIGQIPNASGEMHLSYQELHTRSHRLAGFLRKKGVLQEDIVGIMGEHSVETIIGIMGILKAGAAYLPIDPDYPQERISYMLADSSARMLLTTPLPPTPRQSSHLSLPSAFSTSLAYVIYTSGTTGKPKGAAVQHRSAVNVVTWFGKQFHPGPGVHVLQLSEYSFDPSVEDIFGSLATGATLYGFVYQLVTDINAFCRFVDGRQVHIINFVPTMLKTLLTYGKKLESLKVVISGGEPLQETVKEQIIERGYRLYNNYGPTEVTVDALSGECSRDRVTLGKPISNVRCYVLDQYLNPVPVGVPGELCVSGAGLARGYLNRPELTLERFCLRRPGGRFLKKLPPWTPRKNFSLKGSDKDYMHPCIHASMQYHSPPQYPITPSPHLPIYRTGDLARWLPEGNIEFLGRIDRQLKIRGYRIELEEIENRLLKHDKINQAVVVAKSNEQALEDVHLCAYIVLKNKEASHKTTLNAAELREYLSGFLPGYMVPGYFVQMDHLPLAANGKIDRNALPHHEMEARGDLAVTGDETIKTLAAIWAEILDIGIDKIGINDNFFLLGGHSLKVTVLSFQIHKVFNVKVPFPVIFRNYTIKGLADYIKSQNREQEAYVTIKPMETKEYYPLSAGQKRVYVLQQMEVDNISYNGPELVMLEGYPYKTKVAEIFKKLIKRHESLRTSILLIEDQPFQKIHENVDFDMEYFEADPESARELVKSFVRPFDLSRAPLLRVKLVKVQDDRHILMVDMHHLISDGTSQEIFIKDFLAFYEGKQLPPLRIQYKDYTHWQNSQSETKKKIEKKQEEFWLDQFRDSVPVLKLPTDYQRPGIRSFKGDRIKFTIPQNETGLLNTLASQEEATLFMVLLGIFNIFLSRLSGQEDIVMGTPVAGRNHADLEGIIGMFVNTLALRNYPGGNKTFIQFLQGLKTNVLSAFENQDYQFENLVDKAAKERSSNRTPLFDVMFALQNMDSWNGEIPGLKVLLNHDYRFDNRASKFDMVYMVELENKVLSIELEYSTELFKRETIEMFTGYFKQILSTVVENPHIKLEDIKITGDWFDETLTIGEIDFDF